MAALKVVGIILLILLLLALIRVGALVTFGDALCVQLKIGPFGKTIIPAKKKAPKEKKKQQRSEQSAASPPKKKRTLPKPTLRELRDLATTLLTTLKKMLASVCRRVRIDPLEVFVTVGGSDPAEIAQRYGYLNAAMWSLMPHLEELFHIPDPSLHLRMDYSAEKTRAQGEIGVSIRIGDIVIIACTLALPLLKWYLRFRKAHANDPLPPAAAEETAQTTDPQEEKLPA